MKYIDALKKYNEGKDKWCTPRKGTEDYKKILKLMNGTPTASASSASPVKKSPVVSPIVKKSPKRASSVSPRTKFYNATMIQRFLKNKLILTKNNLDTRVKRYHLIKKRLDNITATDCLTKKMFGKNKGYTLNGVVNLEKKMGSDSAYGVIYLSSMPHLLLGNYPIASKVMEITDDNELETKLNKWITNNLIITKKSKHFVMMYKATKCPVAESAVNKLFEFERLVNYNELCDGDISSLMKTDVRNDETQMINMAYQVLIAVATFQNRVGYCHNDTHHENFLYQINNDYKENDRGYYHYIYKGFNFYIKSCKYNICIFDFAFSSPIRDTSDTEIANDYVKIISGFISNKNINSDMNKQVREIRSKLKAITDRLLAKNTDDMFGEIIEDVFKVFRTDTQIFRTTKPTKVLNKIPFVINEVSDDPTNWE
jgi:hypothetical protein